MFINEKTKEVNCKVVYYGPPLCGKSESLRSIYGSTKSGQKGELISLSNGKDQTLYFDFIPLTFGKVKDYKIRLNLYTVPGEYIYKSNRKIVTKGIDGVVFVVDSQIEKMESNLKSLDELKESLKELGIEWDSFPVVFQYNKQDLKHSVDQSELRTILNPGKKPDFSTIATKGNGVMDTLNSIGSQVLMKLRREDA
jgi:mutual gliding-motility protein MglA